MNKRHILWQIHAALLLLFSPPSPAQVSEVTIDWTQLGAPTKTAITLQVVQNPKLGRESAIHDVLWQHLKDLQADKVRLALWYPYPRLAVAELQPPTSRETHWDFSHIDPAVQDFFAATAGHPIVFTPSTIPGWMFTDGGKAGIPSSPGEAVWDYEDGAQLRDPSGKEVAQYYARMAGWYTKGGFTDERGTWHASGHHFPIAYWEVLNEPEYEHAISVEQYTRIFDQVREAVRRVSPQTKFVGLSLAEPMKSPEKFAYFLNPANHQGSKAVDAISYHFYAQAAPGEPDTAQQYSFFSQAEGFLATVRFVEGMRKRLSPRTETHVNEAGCLAASDVAPGPDHMLLAPSEMYWRLCGAVFAYLYAGLAQQGVDVLGASQLLGYPSQYPSVSLLDWESGQPNPRFRVLQLLHQKLGPGDRPARTTVTGSDVAAAAFVDHSGHHQVLLINKRAHISEVHLVCNVAKDQRHLKEAARPRTIKMKLEPFEVMLTPQQECR